MDGSLDEVNSPLVGGRGRGFSGKGRTCTKRRHGARERAMYSGNREGGQGAAEVMHWEGEGEEEGEEEDWLC